LAEQPSTKPRFRPQNRKLRVYAFDPILSTRIETYGINQVTLQVPWEVDPRNGADCLGPGPRGEYLEVIDYDPASECCYEPVDLNAPYLLEQEGLPPSEGNPQFHQQMVYAVAMRTIRNFEKALGRCALWAPHERENETPEYVQRLRIYPHALREANAYYSPGRKALLFGYFPAEGPEIGENLPGGIVFACLSHNIVAHEITHALLDGLHRRYIEASNPDVLALHEAFADLVALFQQFTIPEVLKDQIARTRGDLSRQNLLGQLAQQLGQAIGYYGALRDALGEVDRETKQWQPKKPDPEMLKRTLEPHKRGSILVAAVFRAFLTVYQTRIKDLLRIASQGTGILPEGELHPDLVNRLASETSRVAGHFLRICIRALDYCPPVDVTFGDYMRALITADLDMVPEDSYHYRIAIIDAFRSWGIYPLDIKNLSVESLLWVEPTEHECKFFEHLMRRSTFKRRWHLGSDRKKAFDRSRADADSLHKLMTSPEFRDFMERTLDKEALGKTLGLELSKDSPATIDRDPDGWPKLEVHSVRPALRKNPEGQVHTDMIIEITQERRGYLDQETQKKEDGRKSGPPQEADFVFRGGCTLVVDMQARRIRYVVSKRVGSQARLCRQRDYIRSPVGAGLHRALREALRPEVLEPFAIVNRLFDAEGECEWLE
jgi:hypothetical protein